MSTRYDYEIVTERLAESPAPFCWSARLSFLVSVEAGQRKPLYYLTLGERWGSTEEEARQKMQRAVEDWIREQADNGSHGSGAAR